MHTLQTLDAAALKTELARVFARYYPEHTADTLAAMHAQMHIQFVAGLAEAPPVDAGSQQKAVRKQPHLARVIQDFKQADPEGARAASRAQAQQVYDELRDAMQSNGANELTYAQVKEMVAHLEPSDYTVRRALNRLEREDVVVRIGRTKFARYRLQTWGR